MTIRPGQLWRFSSNIDWLATHVTDRGRRDVNVQQHSIIHRGSVFVVVSLDDEGPAQFPTMPMLPVDTDINGLACVTWIDPPKKRWHVVMLDNHLVWFNDDWFEQSELLVDT